MTMARVRTIFTGVAGTPWYSNLYFADDGGTPIGSSAVGWVGDMWTAAGGAISNNLAWTIEAEVAQIDESDGELTGLTVTAGETGGGSASDDELPWQTQALGTWATDAFVHGRRVRGRLFWPGMGESNNTAGVPTSGLRAALAGYMNDLITDSAGTLVVWSRPFEGTEDNPARTGTYHLVTGASVSAKWSVLRTRRD
jgi:hypothetical protein